MSDESGFQDQNDQQRQTDESLDQQMEVTMPTAQPRDAGALFQANYPQHLAPGRTSATTNVAPVEVSGGTFGNANLGPTTVSNTTNVGHAGGDYRGAHIGPSYHSTYVMSQDAATSSHESACRQPCPKHPGKNCGKLTDTICLFSNEKLSTAPKSRVYAGAKTSTLLPDELLAIKLIYSYTNKNRREAENLVKLRPHQNVVTIHQADDCTRHGLPRCMFIAMERCSSVNLENYIKKRRAKKVPFNVKQAFEFCRQIIGAMKHIHGNGILHRDLKPSSILFSRCGRFLKICDFGVSKELKFGHSVMSLSMLKLGTDGYRAPETYNEDSITKMVDIFSLALVLYHLMSYGFHPFGLDTEEWNLNIKKGQCCVMSRLRVPFVEIAQDFLNKMLQKVPQNRPKIDAVMEDFAKLDWLTPLMDHFDEIWDGTIKDNNDGDVFPCQLYCSPAVKTMLSIDGIGWNFVMDTVDIFNFDALKNVTDEEPSGYLITSEKEDVKKLTEKLTNNQLMAWISMSKPAEGEKVLVLVCHPDFPELYGFLFPSRAIVASAFEKIMSKQRREGNRESQDPVLPNAPMSAQAPEERAPTAPTGPVPMMPEEPVMVEEEPTEDPEDSFENDPSMQAPGIQHQQTVTTHKEFIPLWIITEI